MKIYIVEKDNNKELYSYLNKNYIIVNNNNIDEAQVIVINKVYNIKEALEIVDYALNLGKEVLCIKNKFAKEHYVCNYLIQNGAMYI